MITLIVVGLAVGLISSFFGVGGGIVMVPSLYLLFPDLPHQMVISTSLGVIFFNGMVNSFNFYKAGKIPNFKIVAWLALSMALGSQIGTRLTFLIPAFWIKKIFAIILVLVIIRILTKSPPPNNDAPPSLTTKPLPTILTGLTAGLIAGISGLGGGIIIVPALLVIYQLPFSWVSTYSNPAMVIGALSGMITFYALADSPINLQSLDPRLVSFQWGYLNFGIISLIVLFSSISSRFGTRLTNKISPKHSQYLFAAMIAVFATRMFLQ